MKKTKKLIVPIALLVLAVMATTSTTFAWITSNTSVTGKLISGKVMSDETMLYIVSPNNATDDTARKLWANWGLTTSNSVNAGVTMTDLTYIDVTDDNNNVGGIVDGTDGATTGLYKKAVYSALASDEAAGYKASTSDYIEVTYTFWSSQTGYTLKFDQTDTTNSFVRKNALNSNAIARPFTDVDRTYFAKSFAQAADFGTSGEYDLVTGWGAVAAFYSTTTAGTGGYKLSSTAVTAYNTANNLTGGNALVYAANGTGSTLYFNASGTYTAEAANAARVMFTEVPYTGSGATPTLGTAAYKGIWEPNNTAGYDAEISTGIDTFARKYPNSIEDMYGKAVTGSSAAPIAYKNPYATDYELTYTSDADLLVLHNFTNADYSYVQPQTGTTFYMTQVKVTVWLEGWDPDCFNAILNDNIDLGFSFRVSTT